MHPEDIRSGQEESCLGAPGAIIEKSLSVHRSSTSRLQGGSTIGVTPPQSSKGAIFTRLASYRECEIEVVVKSEAGYALGGIYSRYRVAWKIFLGGRPEEIASFPERFYFLNEGEALDCGVKRARVFIDSLYSISSNKPLPAKRTASGS